MKNETNIFYLTIVLAILNLGNDIRSHNYQSLAIMVAVTTAVSYLLARNLSFSILMGLVLSSVLQKFLGLKEYMNIGAVNLGSLSPQGGGNPIPNSPSPQGGQGRQGRNRRGPGNPSPQGGRGRQGRNRRGPGNPSPSPPKQPSKQNPPSPPSLPKNFQLPQTLSLQDFAPGVQPKVWLNVSPPSSMNSTGRNAGRSGLHFG